MTYNKTYKNTAHVFGSDPEKILKKYASEIDKSRPILDIGVGQGRNSFYLAKMGFHIDSIDPSSVSIEHVLNISQKENLKINAYQNGFHEFVPNNKPYSAILLFGLIQILD